MIYQKKKEKMPKKTTSKKNRIVEQAAKALQKMAYAFNPNLIPIK